LIALCPGDVSGHCSQLLGNLWPTSGSLLGWSAQSLAALLTWLYDKGQLHAEFKLTEAELRSALEFAWLAASITCSREGAEPPIAQSWSAAFTNLY